MNKTFCNFRIYCIKINRMHLAVFNYTTSLNYYHMPQTSCEIIFIFKMRNQNNLLDYLKVQ